MYLLILYTGLRPAQLLFLCLCFGHKLLVQTILYCSIFGILSIFALQLTSNVIPKSNFALSS